MTEVSIWKISFTISETGERVRLVWDSAGFFRLENIMDDFNDIHPDDEPAEFTNYQE